MGALEELKDPWGWLVAAVLGGLAWVIGIPAVAAVLVAAVVLGTKVAVGAAMHRRPRPGLPARTTDALPPVPYNSPAAVLLQRAEIARNRMAELAERPGDPWLRSEVSRMDDGADEVVASMRDLAGRVTLADQLIVSGNGRQLMVDRAALESQVQATADPVLGEERKRALAAVDGQLAGLQRLTGLRDQLLARMQTAAVGMETVATRMGEVITLGSVATEQDRATEVIADASNDLEALRGGLVEAQQWARGMV